jgi:hypothetical protein
MWGFILPSAMNLGEGGVILESACLSVPNLYCVFWKFLGLILQILKLGMIIYNKELQIKIEFINIDQYLKELWPWDLNIIVFSCPYHILDMLWSWDFIFDTTVICMRG